MRELSRIDQELRQVRRDLDRAGKLDAMLADLGKQHLQRRKEAAEAFEQLNRAEEKEAFLASGREAEHETGKPRRDKREVAQARVRYEEAEWDLQDLEDRLWDVKEERAGLAEQESRYQALLKEKEQYLCCTGSGQVHRLVEIARELGAADRRLREGREALQAGKEARGALSRLRTELAGLPPKDLPQVDLEGFSAFYDDFMDGLFTDLFESSGKDRVQIGVDNTLCEVDTLVKALEKELEEQEKTKEKLSRERETLLAGA